ncbi:unnamed protein product [Paramecium pentaurelia]|uniref:Uncharacterized protein n=1 Tax=Paramecium pentaurelia TaxID=43138 RepID=A0A8S1TAR1_9CILI|nr:unnamed protein product [Paramecium pentaurelia]
MIDDQNIESGDQSQYLRNCDSLNAYEINGQMQQDHFSSLYNQAIEKQQRINQKQEEKNDEIKQQANKVKIDYNSQKILLKKLETQINTVLNRHQIEEQLDYERFCNVLVDLGISTKNDHVSIDLWKLLTLGLDLESAFIGFVFNILVILLEKQLTQSQSIVLLTDVINVELEDQNIPKQVINFEELQELMFRLTNKFKLLNVRFSNGSRGQSSSKKESWNNNNNNNTQVNGKQRQSHDTHLSDTINRFEVLYEHSKVLQEKKRQLESYIQDDPECLFKPQLTSNQTKRQDNVSTFNRLYQNAEAIKMHKQKLKDNLNRQREEEELMECTFKPKLTNKQRYSFKPVKGESAIIERMNKARQMKNEKENFYSIEQTNIQNRPHQTVPEPFDLSKRVQNPKNMLLNVDIRISKNRKARICIREGDDIEQVIKGFAKAHQLSQDQQNVLKETLEQYIN